MTLEHADKMPISSELGGTGQTDDACAYHYDVYVFHALSLSVSGSVPGSGFRVTRFRFWFQGSGFQVHCSVLGRSANPEPEPGTPEPEPGTPEPEPGTPEPGTRTPEPGTCIEPGTRT
jgi:hypothetical protein